VNTGIDRGQGIVKQLFVPRAAEPDRAARLGQVQDGRLRGVRNVAYDVTDNFEASLALRYDSEQRTSRSLVPTTARTQYFDFTPFDNVAGGNAFLNPGLDPAINPGGLQPQDRTFSQLQPKVSCRMSRRRT
jgi:iron complex outermembrane receptor protein